jgi:hypothetical protein
LQGLKRIYTHRDEESEDEWTDEEGDEDVVHTDDEDSKQEMDQGATGDVGDAEDDDEDDEDWEGDDYQSDTLKNLVTPVDNDSIDEFAIFKQTIINVQQHDPEWWNLLAVSVNETNKVLLFRLGNFRFHIKTICLFYFLIN